MTASKVGNQEVVKARADTNVLNPDAPEFNPTVKTGGKLNADAPEFVPGQLPPYDSLLLGVPDMKGGFKNGHVPGYRISHQDPYVPMWISQTYPMTVPYGQVYPNSPYEYIPYDYTRQTQNYPIQRNVYPPPIHNEYTLNMPYNLVAQGKSKLSKPKPKAHPTQLTHSNSQSSYTNSQSTHSNGTHPAHSINNIGKDLVENLSMQTTKDTTRDYKSVTANEVTENKPLTWAERTKLSTTRQQPPTIIHTPTALNATQGVKEKDKDHKPKSNRELRKEKSKEERNALKDKSGHSDKGLYTDSKLHNDKLNDNSTHTDSKPHSDVKPHSDKISNEKEEISYAKVFKEAVRSTPVRTNFAKPNDTHSSNTHSTISSNAFNTTSSTTYTCTVSSKLDTSTQTVPPKLSVPTSSSKLEVPIKSTRLEVASSSASVDVPSNLPVKPEVSNKLSSVPTSFPSKSEPVSTTGAAKVEVTSKIEVNGDVETKEECGLEKVDEAIVNRDTTKTKLLDSPQFASSSTDVSAEYMPSPTSSDYTVKALLGYYVYLLDNSKLVEEIRRRYKLPHIHYSTTSTSTNASNTTSKGYKDRERERQDKNDKKDWRHKNYDKNFGSNFRHKEFTRASSEFTPPVVASEGSWVMKQAKQKNDKELLLRRKIMGLLNRLTFEKFDIIYNQIIECGIDTPEHAEMLVRFVFGKAVTQHHFIPMYVELCAKLAIDLYTIDNTNQVNGSNGSASANSTGSSSTNGASSTNGSTSSSDEVVDVKSNRKSDFMRILLNCSQDSFEDNLKPLEIPSELEGDDRFEYEQKYKHKMRGNMIFVGELFKQKLLAAKLLITCLDQVFLKREECILLYDDVNMGNNHLEAMCTLLQTVGRSFDTNRWKHLSEFEKRIQHLEDLGKNELISFRIRCLIKNVLDSRMDHWDKSVYQKHQEQPCKLQELRHKHSSAASLVSLSQPKPEKTERDKEDVWRMRNRKNKSSSSSNLNSMTIKQDKHRDKQKDPFERKVYKLDSQDLQHNDYKEEYNMEKEEENEVVEDMYKSVNSIVSELVLSHDEEEASLRVEELNLSEDKLDELYRNLIISCMEKCSKVNTEKEAEIVTHWILNLAQQHQSLNHLLNSVYEYVIGEDENSMSVMVEDYPLLPRTLSLLVDWMRPQFVNSDKFKLTLTHLNL
ncbi:uncharacterized protein TA07410 [Theileria annulata]|uniref:MI domain-containing protein n=1 Tax=Theileria annulata TaxID=5874 RepID=Q4UA64_THEAN|nr:uncharacterized protein TA07410 [Theileria annulata]CAI76289.1 hypothetical protein, conserved [Theileria annulata]|eukprot:XP_952913.1 hypothetical protein, conserved [Theileria annulata]